MARTQNGAHPSRVREAAEALLNRGLRPTIQRVRAMLGGGSPNVIAPILKDWRDTLTPEQQLRLPLSEIQNQRPELPLIISDLAAELWKRAIVFATIECKGSPQALQFATMHEETEALRSHNRTLLEQNASSSSDNASLREQMAELQAIAKAALDRAKLSEERFAAASVSLRETRQALAKFRRDGKAKRKVIAHVHGKGQRGMASATKLPRRPIQKSSRSRMKN
jgi:hypothetical protein